MKKQTGDDCGCIFHTVDCNICGTNCLRSTIAGKTRLSLNRPTLNLPCHERNLTTTMQLNEFSNIVQNETLVVKQTLNHFDN